MPGTGNFDLKFISCDLFGSWNLVLSSQMLILFLSLNWHRIMATSYCDFVQTSGKDTVHRSYHDKEYGFPLQTDNELFARLVLEINQAGLSWETILKKKDNFFKAFDNFDIEKVSRYTEKKKEKLLQDAGILLTRLNIESTIITSQKIKDIQKEFCSFK